MRMLRFAIPKGRLLQPVLRRLSDAGLEPPTHAELTSRALVFRRKAVEWILVKDADVTAYVEHGSADAGIAGLDQIEEGAADVYQPVEMEFGRCRLMLIGRPGSELPAPPRNLTVATKYPRWTERWLRERGLTAEIVTLQGSVELALVLELADYIVDLVETGETIRVHGLKAIETIAPITPRLIVNKQSWRGRRDELRSLIEALQAGTLAAAARPEMENKS